VDARTTITERRFERTREEEDPLFHMQATPMILIIASTAQVR